jgi:uncharacterized protein YcfL
MKPMRAFLILLLAVAGGCVTRVERYEPPQPAPPSARPIDSTDKNQTVTDKRVVIDSSLKRVIKIVRMTTKMSPEGYLKIQLNVQNETGAPQHFRYRIDWYDQDGKGLPLSDTLPMDWMLLSHETSFLAATSPTPAARDFRVIFAAN